MRTGTLAPRRPKSALRSGLKRKPSRPIAPVPFAAFRLEVLDPTRSAERYAGLVGVNVGEDPGGPHRSSGSTASPVQSAARVRSSFDDGHAKDLQVPNSLTGIGIEHSSSGAPHDSQPAHLVFHPKAKAPHRSREIRQAAVDPRDPFARVLDREGRNIHHARHCTNAESGALR